MEMSIAKLSMAMSQRTVLNEVSVQLIGNALNQSAVALNTLTDILPAASISDIGGLLDVRA